MDSKQAGNEAKKNMTDSSYICAQCGAGGISTTRHGHEFVYGSGDSAVGLKVEIPIRHCTACDFHFMDSEAEEIKHRAVCRHFGVLPPEAIVNIRKKHGLSRAAFAQVTGLGEASLSRWEKGINIQNPANDRYIRLLEDPRVMQQLQEQAMHEGLKSRQPEGNVLQFRSLKVTEELLQRQATFQLRKAA